MPYTIHDFETATDLLQRAGLSTDKKPFQKVFDAFTDLDQPTDARVSGFFVRPAVRKNPDNPTDKPLSFVLVVSRLKENEVSVLQLAFLSGARESYQGVHEGDSDRIYPREWSPRAVAQAIANSMMDDNKMIGSHEDLVRRASEWRITETLGLTVFLENKAYEGQLRFFSSAAAEISALPQSPERGHSASDPIHGPHLVFALG